MATDKTNDDYFSFIASFCNRSITLHMNPTYPDRYNVEHGTFDGKKEKALYRRDLQDRGNRLYMIRGLSKTRAELENPEHPHRHIYMDGAAVGPYYDKKRDIFSSDHHDLCVRQITDSNCMQTINLARTRVIGALGYAIAGNDPDVDTVFGGWALLNADLIAHDDRVFKRVQPLFIVEGNIDAYGLGYEELTGLSSEVIAEARQRINWLLREERELKQRGRWGTVDFLDYTEDALRKIDRFALYRDALDMPANFTVHEQFPLKNGQSVHYVEAPETGIYEVEFTITSHLQQRDCACIVYHDGRSKWTVKLAGFVNDFSLDPVWAALNVEELRMKHEKNIQDQALLNALWGGGNVIGGPPRYYNGIGPFVSKERIIEIATKELEKQIA